MSAPGVDRPLRESPEKPRRPLGRSLILAAALVALALVLRWSQTRSWPFWDLDVYLAGGRSLIDSVDLYGVSLHGLVFTYPPFAAVLFVPLASTGAGATWILTSVSLLCLGLVGVVIANELGLSRVLAAVIVLGGLALEPVTRTLVLGQINVVLVALVVIDLFVLPRRYRGLLVGLAAGIKLTPAIFVVYYLIKRDFGSVARSVISFVVTVGVGWLVAPEASRTYWTGRFLQMESFGNFQIESANQSIRGCLIRVLGTPDPPPAVWAMVACATLALGIWATWRRVQAEDDVGAMLALASTGLLVSPISWTHHWVWVVVALLYAVSRNWLVGAWLVGAIFFIAPMWLLPAGGGAELRLDVWQVVVSVTYVAVGLVGLLLLGVRQGGPPRGVAR